MSKIRVLVWNEYIHERRDKAVQKIYGLEGIHGHIAKFLNQQADIDAQTATLDDEDDAGLSEKNLKNTDVLIWWGHTGHHLVEDALVDRIQRYVINGMGLIVLHSGHFSKIFKRMMGTSCGLNWREDAGRELLWVANPYHPISKGIEPVIELDHEEMYGEYFDIPPPEELIFISWFEGGEVFRSGCTWHRGRGKIFYFRPGHETFPTYTGQSEGSKQVLQVITNAVRWCKFEGNLDVTGVGQATHVPFSLAPVKKYEFEALKEHPKESNK